MLWCTFFLFNENNKQRGSIWSPLKRKRRSQSNKGDFAASSRGLLLSKCFLSGRVTAERKYWLAFRRAEQVWQNIADAKPLLRCLGAQQVKTPRLRSSRLFSCYICTAHSQPCCLRSQRRYKSWRARRRAVCRGTAWLDGVSRGYKRQPLPISCGWWWWASPGL